MKKILLLLAVALVAFVGCEDEKNGLMDPSAMISIRPATNTRTEATPNPERLTALQVVEQATDLEFWNKEIYGNKAVGIGFTDVNRDIPNVRLLMRGTHIIDQDGKYVPDFIEGEDIVLWKYRSDEDIDTIAYVKNATLRSAEILIKDAYAKQDYEACYALFDEAFTFIPITGAEWRELKDQDKN